MILFLEMYGEEFRIVMSEVCFKVLQENFFKRIDEATVAIY